MPDLSRGTIERLKLHFFQGRSAGEIFLEMHEILSGDVLRAKQAINDSDDQFSRRRYLNALTAFAEATLFQLKQVTNSLASELGFGITANEEQILNEHRTEMQENGTLATKEIMITHKLNVKFTLRFVARKLKCSRQPDFAGEGWNHYRRTLELRNFLTHPKFPSDLLISDEDLEKAFKAEGWFRDETGRIIIALAAAKSANAPNNK